MTTFFAGQIPTANELNSGFRKLLGYGQRTVTSTGSTSTTAVSVLRLDSMSWTSTHLLQIGYTCHKDSPTATDNIRTEVRLKAGGTSAVSTDAIIQGSQCFHTPTAVNWSAFYLVGSSDTYSVLLTFARNTGAGTCTLFCDANRVTELWVADWGIISDTGVDL